MARKKRPYVPKVKGCYQCSQRRIDCDGGKPSCGKCTIRGLPCSGYGMTFRFRDGLTGSAGKAVTAARMTEVQQRSRSVSASSVADAQHVPPAPALSVADSSVDAVDSVVGSEDSPQDALQQENDRRGGLGLIGPSLIFPSLDTAFDDCCFAPESDDRVHFDIGDDSHVLDFLSSLGMMLDSDLVTGHGQDDEITNNFTTGLAEPSLAPEVASQELALHLAQPVGGDISYLDPWKEFLLSYFSDHIAPEMVVLDDSHNGWRQIVLPIAHSDDLIMSTVLAVAAFHFTGKIAAGRHIVDPAKLYGQAIRHLQRRRELDECDGQTKHFIVLALLVLLVAVMVNGCCDFPIVFNMLESAIDALGGEEGLSAGGEIAAFALRQIRKMRVYAAPLLSQDAGVKAIMAHSEQSFDCLSYYGRLHPHHQETFGIIASLRQQAYRIYLHRALASGDRSEDCSIEAVENFVSTMKSLREGAPGQHILIWSAFIAASEARAAEHRDYLWKFLDTHYQRNRFTNVSRGLELLERIWSGNALDEWPALIPEPRVFIM